MTDHTPADELLELEEGQTATITGDVVHVGPYTVDVTQDPERHGRQVSLFVETTEQPVSLDDGRTFGDLLTEPGSLEHAAGSGMPIPLENRPDSSALPSPRPDATLGS